MKTMMMIAMLAAGLSVSGCWKEAGQDKREQFSKALTKCGNCAIDKPFLSTGSDTDGN